MPDIVRAVLPGRVLTGDVPPAVFAAKSLEGGAPASRRQAQARKRRAALAGWGLPT